jgi:hypothetical protein
MIVGYIGFALGILMLFFSYKDDLIKKKSINIITLDKKNNDFKLKKEIKKTFFNSKFFEAIIILIIGWGVVVIFVVGLFIERYDETKLLEEKITSTKGFITNIQEFSDYVSDYSSNVAYSYELCYYFITDKGVKIKRYSERIVGTTPEKYYFASEANQIPVDVVYLDKNPEICKLKFQLKNSVNDILYKDEDIFGLLFIIFFIYLSFLFIKGKKETYINKE